MNKQISPHTYPLWIKLSTAVLIIPLGYFLTKIPHYCAINYCLKQAQYAYEQKDYARSLALYKTLLQDTPSCQKAQTGIERVSCVLGVKIW